MRVSGPQPRCKGRILIVSWCQEVQEMGSGLPKGREAKGRAWSRAESAFGPSQGGRGWPLGSAPDGFRGVKGCLWGTVESQDLPSLIFQQRQRCAQCSQQLPTGRKTPERAEQGQGPGQVFIQVVSLRSDRMATPVSA